MEDHGRQLSKTIQDVASKIGGAKATGMFKTMMSSTSATFSGSNIVQNLSPRRSSNIQEGTPINSDLDTEAVEAALMDAALDGEDDEVFGKSQSSTH